MTLRRSPGSMALRGMMLAAALAATVATAPGCVTPASVDPDWATLEGDGDERLVYARSRGVECARNAWIGRGVAALGAILTTAAVIWWHESEHMEDDGHDVKRVKRRAAWFGGASAGILTAGVGYAGFHEEQAEQWALLMADEQLRRGGDDDAAPKKGVQEPKKGESIAAGARGRLYIAHDETAPALPDGFEIVRVRNAADPALAHLGRALGAVKLPLLVMAGDGAAARPTYAMGDRAVASVLAVQK